MPYYPPADPNLAYLNVVQTWPAAQTFAAESGPAVLLTGTDGYFQATPAEDDAVIVFQAVPVAGAGYGFQKVYFEYSTSDSFANNSFKIIKVNSAGAEPAQLRVDDNGWTFTGTVTTASPNLWTQQQNQSIATLTSSSASVAWNLNTGQSAVHTLTENTTLANPTNMVNGGTYVLRIVQHASSPKTLAWGSAYKWPGGSAPTISSTNGAIDIVTFVSDGSSMFGSIQKAFA